MPRRSSRWRGASRRSTRWLPPRDPSLEPSIGELLSKPGAYPVELRITALDYLSDLDAAWVGQVVLANYRKFRSPSCAHGDRIADRAPRLGRTTAGCDRARRDSSRGPERRTRCGNLLVRADEALAEKVKTHWGTFANRARSEARGSHCPTCASFLRRTPGDPAAGQEVFKRVCGAVPQALWRGPGRGSGYHGQRPQFVRAVAVECLRPQPGDRRGLSGTAPS